MAQALASKISVMRLDMSSKRLGNRESFNPTKHGYNVSYRENEVNRCPGCGRTHWYVGRVTAECAFCATAVPLNQ